NLSFRHLDITTDPLPYSDMMMCRDCLFHLKNWLRWKVLENFATSNSRYLMLTMHHVGMNTPVKVNGGFQRFNPTMAPFHLPTPLELINETADGLADMTKGDHRSLGIWSHEQVAEALANREETDPASVDG
ncbi:MAG: hypothetical protein ORN49_04245, partial [Rhodobacteraceae bacterium]|nr:hypothetical protein [Paracoccaceae bacterium]